MSRILVSGLINLETTLQVKGFPLEYFPVTYPFFGVNTTVAGVGLNIAKALATLGDQVTLLSLVGKDSPGELVYQALNSAGLPADYVLPRLDRTAQSVILYDPAGRRQIHTDLKDIQEQSYPFDRFERALASADLAVICNINFSRPFLEQARRAGILIATDVHALSDLEDRYNQDFMANADILFMSDERLPLAPEDWARRVLERYAVKILVIGLGDKGALMAIRKDDFLGRFPAVQVRPVLNTIGAGDALFSAFIHDYLCTGDPYHALRSAAVFAGYKIGVAGAADGFLDAETLEKLTTHYER
jgi:acarbose 7IV-phosphotransferase